MKYHIDHIYIYIFFFFYKKVAFVILIKIIILTVSLNNSEFSHIFDSQSYELLCYQSMSEIRFFSHRWRFTDNLNTDDWFETINLCYCGIKCVLCGDLSFYNWFYET